MVLSPFVVSSQQDTGYIASNTLAGSRLNTSLENTPLAISVLTKDFIDDIGAVKVSQALEYATGSGNDIGGGASQVGATTGNGLIGNDYNFMIRGYRSVQTTRDFFPTILQGDVFNLERIDIAWGPNSTLFGVGGAGGIVNFTPKRAQLTQDITRVDLRTESYDFYRAALDINRHWLGDKLGVRINLMDQKANGYFDFETDNEKKAALAVTWHPVDSLTIRIDGEDGRMHENRVRPWGPFDNITPWIAAGSYFSPFGTGEVATVAGDNNYSQSSPFSGIFGERREGNIGTVGVITDGPLAGKELSLGTRALGQRYYRVSHGINVANFNSNVNFDNPDVFPQSGNVTGPGAYVETNYHNFGLTVEQRIGRNLFVEGVFNQSQVTTDNHMPVAFNQNAIQYDVTSTLPTFNNDYTYAATPGSATEALGTIHFSQVLPNPYVGSLIVAAYQPSADYNKVLQRDARLSATYHLDLGGAGDYHVLAFVSRSEQKTEYKHTFETNIAADRPDPTYYYNGVNFGGRSTHIDPFSADLSLHGVPDPWTHPLPSGRMYGQPQYGFIDGWIQGDWTKNRNSIDTATLATQGSFLHESLFATVGVRRDRVKVFQSDSFATDDGIALSPVLHGTADVDQSANTYSIGAVYRFPFAKWLSVFANKSTNFKDQFGATLFGDQNQQQEVGPLRGTGKDAGLKFDLLDSRLSATVDFFEVVQSNAAAGFNGAIPLYIQSMWDAILNNGSGDLQDSEQPNGHNPSGGDTRSAKSKGFEVEVTANLTKEWRLAFNVSKADNIVSDVDTAVQSYVKAHTAEWTSKSSLPINTGRYGAVGGKAEPTIADSLAEIQADIALDRTQEGGIEPNIRPWNANLFTAYTFSHAALKNFTIGGGVNYRGKEVLYNDPTTHANIMGRDYYLANGMLAYQFKLGKTAVKVQFNVNNLLNNQDKQVLAGGLTPTVTAPNAPPHLALYTYYLRPISYSLSAGINF